MDWDSNGLRPREITKLIDINHPKLTISRQTELLGLARSSYYYQPIVNETTLAELKRQLNAIDEIYTKRPYYGNRRIQYELAVSYDIIVGRDRVRSLMSKLGLEAVYPKPNTSKPDLSHRIYPYLLKGIKASYSNHIWGTDITYVKTAEGFVYLVAFIDWYSRYVVSWELSDSLENSFVILALKQALMFLDDCGFNLPKICNSDQGSHFTSTAYLELLEEEGINISMDGKGRYLDNIFTERLWRTVKYEDIYLRSYQNLNEASIGLTKYFKFYNHQRPHSAIDNKTPAEVYFELSEI